MRQQIFVKFADKILQTIFIETPESGKLRGDEVVLKTIEAVPEIGNLLTAIRKDVEKPERFLIIKLNGANLNPYQEYIIQKDMNVVVSINAPLYEAAKRDVQSVDELIITLAQAADACVIGCYLLSAPGNKNVLEEQQCLTEIMIALNNQKKLTIVLVDPNFANKDLSGQIVEYLQKNEQTLQVKEKKENLVFTYTFTSYKNNPAYVTVIYIGKFVGKLTENALKERKLGRWYAEEK